MNLPKLAHISSSIKPSFKTPTINLSFLESHLHKCKTLNQFNQILSQMISTGYINDTFAASKLLKFSTHSPLNQINNNSFKIFNLIIPNSNGFIWNTMIRACLQRKNHNTHNALFLYKSMLIHDVAADNYTYPLLFQGCRSEIEGKLIHCHVLELGFGSDVYVNNTLINFYSGSDNMGDARKVFDECPVLDLVTWNSILAGYVQAGVLNEAMWIYEKMPERNVISSNSMIVLFGKRGNVSEAHRLFDEMPEKDLVSWTALISCYEQNEMYDDGLALFVDMIASGIITDEVVIVSVLSCCAHLSIVKMGKLTHALAVKIGTEFYVNLRNALIHMYSRCGDIISAEQLFNSGNCLDLVSWNSMIHGYLRCGLVEKARALFDFMPEKDIVSWSTMISGYAQDNQFSETLDLFQEMQLQRVKPDVTTLVSVVSACTHMAALDQGKWIHAYIKKNGIKMNVFLGTTLIDMYMKLGCVENAMEVFNGIDEKGVSTWNTLILGLAMNGLVEKSLNTFLDMKKFGVAPNEITLMAVLGACRHMGLVNEGRYYFNSMLRDYKIEANVKHYGCMVDLLGRAGMLKEAEELIKSMPMAPDVATWGALLGACRKHGDNKMGARVGKKLIELQPDHDGFHVLLSNIYASKGNWEGVLEIRDIMVQHGVYKIPGCSMIEADGTVHEFLAGDTTHCQINMIEIMLDEMARKLKIEGYVPDINEVWLDIDQEEKETTLFRHSEKLAIAFGLLNIPSPMPIRIMKNLRICNDCHSVAKLVSKAFDREIVVRDRHRFHHFKHGSCSCIDYW